MIKKRSFLWFYYLDYLGGLGVFISLYTMKFHYFFKRYLLIFSLAYCSFAITATVPLLYFDVDPKIMTLYQKTGHKLGYVVVQINLAVKGEKNIELLELHTPLIQDALIDFFNRQDEKSIQDIQKRSTLIKGAKKHVSNALKEELGQDIIESLLFTDYVYQ
jgi:flagellar basal body-associated protein FliL